MRCVSDAFSDGAVLAAAPVNHDYNGEERWEQWCRKSRSDNYNARDKIMGTRCTLPIISCISSRVTPTPQPPITTITTTTATPPLPYWQPAITGHICEIQKELIWWQRRGLWSIAEWAHVCVQSFVKCQRVLTRTIPQLNKHASTMLLQQDGGEEGHEASCLGDTQDMSTIPNF